MLDLFGREFDDPASYHASQPDDEHLASLLARDTFVAIVAEIDGRIVAGAWRRR